MPIKDPEKKKEYQREYNKKHYASNKKYYLEKRKKNRDPEKEAIYRKRSRRIKKPLGGIKLAVKKLKKGSITNEEFNEMIDFEYKHFGDLIDDYVNNMDI